MKSFLSVLLLTLCLLFSSLPVHAQWKHSSAYITSSTQNTWAFATIGNNVFAGLLQGGVYMTNDNGAFWKAANKGIEYEDASALIASGSTLYAGIYGKGVYRSTDNGSSWTAGSNGLNNKAISSLAVNNLNYIFAGTFDGGVYISADGGANWSTVNNGLSNINVNCLLANGTTILAGTKGGIYRSTDNGKNWSAVNTGLTDFSIQALVISGSNIYAGTVGFVYLSADNGTSWKTIGVTTASVVDIAATGKYVFVGISGTSIYLTSDNGASWSDVGSGYRFIKSLGLNKDYIFEGAEDFFIYYRKLNEMITTAVTENSGLLPEGYSLKQNYPNPFNPETAIDYTIQNEGPVKLTVYNTLGSEVQNLVNEVKSSGSYTVRFNASGLTSGIYYYRLESGGFSAVRKFMVVK